MAERIGLDTPLRDVAGMLRSFDYVALHTLLAEHADDLAAAVHKANELSRPWGWRGPTPREAWESRPPAMAGRKAPRLYYCSQVRHSPPHFVLFTNLPKRPHFSYLRYLENVLRQALGLALYRLDRWEQALQQFRRGLELDGNGRHGQRGLGRCGWRRPA